MNEKRPAGRPGAGSAHPYGNGPWSASAQSLVPSDAELGDTTRRKLLLIYLHGYMGNDQSFQSFPAHVHSYLKLALAETHVIHTKIYPRYKTYKHMEVARDNFSRWLEPHESPTTDVIIVGHSMGGLLAAEIVLLPPRDHGRPDYFRHRILGTINMDAPLLGLHPGIVVSGISSLFRSDDKPNGAQAAGEEAGPSQTSLNLTDSSTPSDAAGLSPVPSPAPSRLGAASDHLPGRTMTFDPNYNPNFPNDIRLQDRGWWQNVVHFVKKHNAEGLIDATTKHFISHLEFGGTLFDFQCLKTRYYNLRKLEDVDDLQNQGFPHVPKQVRFAQYYTVCYGFPKSPKAPKSVSDGRPDTAASAESSGSRTATTQQSVVGNRNEESQIEPSLNAIPKEDMPDDEHGSSEGEGELQLTHVDPAPIDEPAGSDLDAAPPPYSEFPPTLEDNLEPSEDPPEESPSCAEVQTSETVATSQQDTPEELAAAISAVDLDTDLPAIPDEPVKPEPLNMDDFPDKDSRQAAEKEAKAAQKSYDQAVKLREKAIKDRQKAISKHEKKKAQEEKKQAQEEKKQAQEEQKRKKTEEKKLAQEEEKLRKTEEKLRKKMLSGDTPDDASAVLGDLPAQAAAQSSPFHGTGQSSENEAEHQSLASSSKGKGKGKQAKAPKGKKERKFCNLPPKVNGQLDPKWIKVSMGDVDEVVAHTGLFFPGEHYERLVGDVGHLVVQWVHEDASKRAVMEMG